MEKTYWLGRKRAALAIARAATCSEVRLASYDEAGRHSVRAAFAPFMLPNKGPVTDGEREALRMPRLSRPRTPLAIAKPRAWPRGHKPGDGA